MLKEAVVLLLTALFTCCLATTEHLLQEGASHLGLQEPQGFAVQTGYEGFLVPTEQTSPNLLHALPLAGIAPVLGFKAIAKAGLWFFGLVMIILTGAGLASAVCAFTPLCTLGLAFGRQNSDKLQILTTFVHNALDKYKRLQKN
ncbi:uncharacterized protein LOC111050924 [Nilaparvata lugens]|uniref:uncharacterized protein LOC111050924 n=1 Tax=Nilaparvata lugens TaxID=108931 RepID=UPI000B980735|nr:uncharacterized protein LOC111050924 [Nilaparvata lugens]